MNSTTVPSNNEEQRNTASVAGSVFVATENTLEIPPKGQVFEAISSYIEEKGNIEIPVGNCKLNENGILETENGEISIGEEAYKSAVNNKKNKKEMKAKAEAKEAKSAETYR